MFSCSYCYYTTPRKAYLARHKMFRHRSKKNLQPVKARVGESAPGAAEPVNGVVARTLQDGRVVFIFGKKVHVVKISEGGKRQQLKKVASFTCDWPVLRVEESGGCDYLALVVKMVQNNTLIKFKLVKLNATNPRSLSHL